MKVHFKHEERLADPFTNNFFTVEWSRLFKIYHTKKGE